MPPQSMLSGPLRPGTIVAGKFALIRQIGAGGTGIVFEAEEPHIARRVALKVLHPNIAADTDVAHRFIREAHAATRINHPNIITVHEIGKRRDGSYYLVQELLRGVSLRDRLKDRGRLSPAESTEILVPIMGALVAAHDVGIVHRDVKPDNIFLASDAIREMIPKLIDFGLAKVLHDNPFTPTDSGKQWGTVLYMAPEQAGQGVSNALVDVWAIGVVLFELLTGGSPFDAPTPFGVINKLLNDNAPRADAIRPDIPKRLADIIAHALERDVERRYRTMRAFLDDVLEYVEQRDPLVRMRHANSIPRSDDVESSDTTIDEDVGDEPPESLAHPNLDEDFGLLDTSPAPGLAAGLAAAEQALRINALGEAVEEAERAIATFNPGGRAYARMRCVQTIALRWLGDYAESERRGIEALGHLDHGSDSWYAVVGNLAIAYSYQNKREATVALAKAQMNERFTGDIGPARIGALCCLAVALLRVGVPDLGQTMFDQASVALDGEISPLARAWIHVASAELAVLAGDPVEYLRHLEDAVTGFSEAGDIRNACLQRANIGNAYMQLGAYERAVQVLLEAFPVIEPMKLAFVVAVRTNLGLALVRRGDVEQALAAETWAIRECVKQGYKRFESIARLYLAEIQRRRGSIIKAEAELRAVIAMPEKTSFHAVAQACLAEVLLHQERVSEAASFAKEAMETLETFDGVEEGEALIRLVYVLVLDATKRRRSADAHLAGARQRLLERASRINDSALRQSFLENVPENRRTLELAARLDSMVSPEPRVPRSTIPSDSPISIREPG